MNRNEISTQENKYSDLEWLKTREHALSIYKNYMSKEIANEEYLRSTEKLYRDFLFRYSNHELGKQSLADILQKQLIEIDHLNELFRKNEIAALNEQEQLYKELMSLSTLQRYKKGLAKSSFLLSHTERPLKEQIRLIADILYPKHAYTETICLYLSEECVLKDDVEWLTEVERCLRGMLEIVPSQTVSSKLAQLLFYKAQMEVPRHSFVEKYDAVKGYFRECLLLDPKNEQYRNAWLGYLNGIESDLSAQNRTEELVSKRVDIHFEILKYDPRNTRVKERLESLLLQQEEAIYEKEDLEQISNREAAVQLEKVYSKLIKLSPANASYRYSLATLKYEKGKLLKGARQNEAYQLFQEVLRIDPNHIDAGLKMANIHLVKSEWMTAYTLLNRFLSKLDRIKGKDTEIEFCLIYSLVNAKINNHEEAENWLNKACLLDRIQKYEKDIFSTRLHVNLASESKHYTIYKIGHEKTVANAVEVDRMINEYEDNRKILKEPKLFFDFRDLDSTKLIGPKGTEIIKSEERVSIIKFLLESKQPKSLEQIKHYCNLQTLSRVSMQNLRTNIAKVFCDNGYADELKWAREQVLAEVLVTVDSKYQWAFKGETYLIKMDDRGK